MYITLFVCVLGGGAFLVASLYIEEDKKKVDDEIKSKLIIPMFCDRVYLL